MNSKKNSKNKKNKLKPKKKTSGNRSRNVIRKTSKTNKGVKKKSKNNRPTNHTKSPKQLRNQFGLMHIKKLIGKKLLIPWKGLTITDKDKKSSININKNLIDLAKQKNYKNIILTVVSVNGVLYIIKGIDRYLAINQISYKDIKKYNMNEFVITLVCYQGLTQSQIKKMI